MMQWWHVDIWFSRFFNVWSANRFFYDLRADLSTDRFHGLHTDRFSSAGDRSADRFHGLCADQFPSADRFHGLHTDRFPSADRFHGLCATRFPSADQSTDLLLQAYMPMQYFIR